MMGVITNSHYLLVLIAQIDVFPMIGDHSKYIEPISCRAEGHISPLACKYISLQGDFSINVIH
jgi:hypothetical protein